jgi:prevent-host-death family protein
MARESSRTVGVRQLRQNLSVYLDRVKLGEALTVTEHGEEIAILRPMPPDDATPLERLVAEGQARPPRRPLREVLPQIHRVKLDRPSEEILDELREERLR